MQSHDAAIANRAALGAASFMAPPSCGITIQKPGHAAAPRTKNRPTLPCPEPKPRRLSQAKHVVREVVDGRVAKAAASHHCSRHCTIRKCRAGGRQRRRSVASQKTGAGPGGGLPPASRPPSPASFSAAKPPVASWPGASPLKCHWPRPAQVQERRRDCAQRRRFALRAQRRRHRSSAPLL